MKGDKNTIKNRIMVTDKRGKKCDKETNEMRNEIEERNGE